MLEITAALLVIAFVGAVFYALKEWGKSEAFNEVAETDYNELLEAKHNADKAQKMRPTNIDDTLSGL